VDVVIAPAGVGTITETNQRLEMLKLTAGDGYLGLQSRCAVRGDFDVEGDFSLLNWPAANFHAVRLAALGLPPGPGGLVGVSRNSFTAENYQFRTAAGTVATVTRTDLAGKLQIKRTGASIQGFYWDGSSFVLLGSSATTTDDTRVVIDFAGASGAPVTPPAGVAIAFDNFTVNIGTVVCASTTNSAPASASR
jgi:hypothetical protein